MKANLRDLQAMVKWAASKEETRYYLRGVHVHSKPGYVHLAATNGHVLFVERIKSDEEFSCIIPSEFITSFKLDKRDKGECSIVMDGEHIRINRDNESRSTRPIDGTYPAYERIFPQSGFEPQPSAFRGVDVLAFDELAKAYEASACVTPNGSSPGLVTFGKNTDIMGVISPRPSTIFNSIHPFKI